MPCLHCAAILAPMGAVVSLPLHFPTNVSVAGYGSPIRRDFFKSFLPFFGGQKFFKAATGGHHNGTAVNLLYLRIGKQTVVIVTLDVVAVPKELYDDIAKILQNRGIETGFVHVVATHTHSGPGGFADSPLWEKMITDQFNPAVYAEILRKVDMAFSSAETKSVEVDLYAGEIALDSIQKSRRSPAANIRKSADVLLLKEKEGEKILGAWLNVPVHGTALGPDNLVLNGDLPAAIRQELKKHFPAAEFLFTPDASADVAPFQKGADGLLQMSAKFYRQFLNGINANQLTPLSFETQYLTAKRHRVWLGEPKFSPAKCLGANLDEAKRGLNYVPPISAGWLLPQELDVWTLHLGNMSFTFWPGEITTAVGYSAKTLRANRFGLKSPWNVTLANGYVGYFTSPSEYRLGGYESCGSLYGERGAQRLTSFLAD